MIESKAMRVRADFNGLFGELLCLSHKDTCEDADGNLVALHAGMVLTAFDEDVDEHGNRDDLIASGTVEPSPKSLRCLGSRWVLRMDRNGVRHESDLRSTPKDIYKSAFVQGTRVRVAERAFLERFMNEWKYHHKLQPEQLAYAGTVAVVEKVSFYHGGDVLYNLKDIPGTWHEQCLLAV